ncbi:MAG: hypothetical protein JW812_03305 [Alphaproteobacteria bacterium]|nr:hypothetical protein [Alphaproteobacteria bacterium]
MFPLLQYLAATKQPLYITDGTEDIFVLGAKGPQKFSDVEPKIKTANLEEDYNLKFKSLAEENDIEVVCANPPAGLGWTFATLEEREQVNWVELFKNPLKLPSIETLFLNEEEAKVFTLELENFRSSFITVSEKLDTDDAVLTAEEKSIGWGFFDLVKGLSDKWVLGQHFSKTDSEGVLTIAEKYGVQVFDKRDASGLLGWRGIDFSKQAHLMNVCVGMLNIASTTSWMALTMFPERRQTIYFANKDSNKIWKTIADALPTVQAIGFDSSSDLEEIAEKTKSFFK